MRRLAVYLTLIAALMLFANGRVFAKGGGHGGGGHHSGGDHHGEEHHEAHHAEHSGEHHGEAHHAEGHHDAHHEADHRLNERPDWNHLSHDQHAAVHDVHRNALNHHGDEHDMHHWLDHHPERREHYRHWAQQVRHDHRTHPRGWDHHNWWRHHFPFARHWWNYNHYWNHYPWNVWWSAPSWHTIGDWFPEYAFADPVYYDYGPEGNVYQDNAANTTYIAGQNAGTAVDYASTVAELATVDPPSDAAENDATEWLPLGNFALSSNEKDTEPTRVVQLAVNKQGILSGMLYNETTGKSLPIQGRVDRELQRVAFRAGNNRHAIFETGIYDLTQDEVPLLIHFGADRTQNALLVRLDPPASEEDDKLADRTTALGY